MSFRTTAARSIPRSLSTITTTNSRSLLSNNGFRATFNTFAHPSKASNRLSLVPRKPLATSLIRYQHNVSGITGGKSFEEAYSKEKLPSTPQIVSAESSIHNVRSEVGADSDEHDVDMMAGIRSDFVCPICPIPVELRSLAIQKLTDLLIEHHPGNLHTERRAKGGFIRWVGRGYSISSNVTFDCIPLLGHSTRCSHRHWLSHVRRDGRTATAYYRAYSTWVWRYGGSHKSMIGRERSSNRNIDHFIPRRNSLGPGMGWFWWPSRLSAICDWDSCDRCCVANTPPIR